MTQYEGWKNRSTWNVALWINNEYQIYLGAVAFMKNYKGAEPYKAFIKECGLDAQKTPDGIAWKSHLLDYAELNEMMKEFQNG